MLIIRLTHSPGKYEFHSRMLRFERANSAPIRLAISVELSESRERAGAKIDRRRDASMNIVGALHAGCENLVSTANGSLGLFATSPTRDFYFSLCTRLEPVLIHRLPDLDHAALFQQLRGLLRRWQRADVVPVLRVIGSPLDDREHLLGD
jgi:hypothetical protein